jgi:hypothetical protein
MRDSINYNLKYFIMKMSGTKPMKNTMRKPSPLKFFTPVTAATDAVNTAVSAAKKSMLAAKKAKAAGTTKPVEGKPSSKPTAPRGPLASAKARQEKVKVERAGSKVDRAAAAKAKMDKYKSGSKATPMQMKKSGMKKKC